MIARCSNVTPTTGNRDQQRLTRLRALLDELTQTLSAEPMNSDTIRRCRLLAAEASHLGGCSSDDLPSGPVGALSTREREIALALSNGQSNSAIAAHLFISVNTVRFHVANILRKLGARNRIEVAAIVARTM